MIIMTLFESILNEGKNSKLANHYALLAERIYDDYVKDAFDEDAEEKYEDLADVFEMASKTCKTDQVGWKFQLQYWIDHPEEHFRDYTKEDFETFIKENTDEDIVEQYNEVKKLFLPPEKFEKLLARERAHNKANDERMEKVDAEHKAVASILEKALKPMKLKFDIEEIDNASSWSIILNTEDEDTAEEARNRIGEALGVSNSYGASYDDIQGMGDIHIGCMPYYEWSEMCGSDSYEDLDEDIREQYVIFGCPAKKWKRYRQVTDW